MSDSATPSADLIECQRCHAQIKRRGRNHKWCETCQPVELEKQRQAYRDKQGRDAINAAHRAAYAAATPEQRRAWRGYADTEESNAYQRQWAARKSAESRFFVRAKSHRTTVAVLERMWDEQQGLCAICEDALGDDFHVDHDPATGKRWGKLRGLLCPLCNKGLGHFRDSTRRLRRAADYLDRHSGLTVPSNLVRRSRSVAYSTTR
jgi:hypothetical protein